MRKVLLRFLLAFVVMHAAARAQGKVDRLYIEGDKAQEKGDFAGAIQCWDAVIKANPGDAVAWFNRGNAFASLGENEKAVSNYTEAIRFDAKDPAALEARARLCAKLMTQDDPAKNEQAAKYKAMIFADCAAVVKLRLVEGRQEKTAFVESVNKMEFNLPILGVAYWTAMLEIDPADWKTLACRALDYFKLHDPEKELADCNEAIRLNPDCLQAYRLRAEIYERENQGCEKQLADLGEMIRIEPRELNYEKRAEILVYNGDYTKALADFDKAVALNNDKDDGARAGRGKVYGALGKWDEAEQDFTAAIGIFPNHPYGYSLRAWAWKGKGDYARAVADLKMAVRIEATEYNGSDAPAMLVQLGEAYYLHGDYGNALTSYSGDIALIDAGREKALAVLSKGWAQGDYRGLEAAAWLLAACPDAKFRDGAKAVELAKQACVSTHWKEAGPIDTLAAAEAETGQWEQAVAYEKQAIDAAKTEEDRVVEYLTSKSRIASIPEARGNADKIIAGYTARMDGYAQKKPCRACKEIALWGQDHIW